MQTETRFAIDTLWVDSVGVRPVPIDWDDAYADGDGWESFAAPECPECGAYATHEGHEWICGDAECDNRDEIDPHEDMGSDPVMSYYYPLPDINRIGDEYAAAEAIADLPLCVVRFGDGNYALALTGGGMDLSWEICEAFTRLGFLPPIHFCDLPRMAGYPRGEAHRYVIEACKRSAEVAQAQASRIVEHLQGFDA